MKILALVCWLPLWAFASGLCTADGEGCSEIARGLFPHSNIVIYEAADQYDFVEQGDSGVSTDLGSVKIEDLPELVATVGDRLQSLQMLAGLPTYSGLSALPQTQLPLWWKDYFGYVQAKDLLEHFARGERGELVKNPEGTGFYIRKAVQASVSQLNQKAAAERPTRYMVISR